tara:strand:- start:556 stop:882 length:327 start_codon:yes stop_codon:yes gene_type:complete
MAVLHRLLLLIIWSLLPSISFTQVKHHPSSNTSAYFGPDFRKILSQGKVLSQAEKGSFMIEDSSGGFRSTTAIWIIYEDYLYLCNIDNDNGYPDGWCSRKTNNNDEKD